MTTSFDLHIIPLYRIKGQEQGQTPGLLATTAPKHAARGRENDTLVLYLTLAGNAPVSSTEYNQIAAQMAQRFYQVAGALTSAIRTTAELLNQYLVERNMRTTSQGQYMIGRTILAVLREDQLTLAQCGPTRVFLLSGGDQRPLHDANLSGRGLGIGQSIPLHLAQCQVKPGDRLVFCTHSPAEWEQRLPILGGEAPEALRQHLAEATPDDLNAMILGLDAGRGIIHQVKIEPATPQRVESAPVAAAVPEPSVSTPPATPTETAAEEQATHADGENLPEEKPTEQGHVRLDQVQPGRFVRPLTVQPESTPTPGAVAQEAPEQTAEADAIRQDMDRIVSPKLSAEIPEITRPQSEKSRKIYRGMANGVGGFRSFSSKLSQGFERLLKRLVPGSEEDDSARKRRLWIFIAVAIPVLIITVAVVVYLRTGRSAQYEENYLLAERSALSAIQQTDPLAQQVDWESTLFYLDKAEKYQVTVKSQGLRKQAEAALDAMDRILRLEFKAAIYGGLEPSVQITHMAATGSELYLLDATTGSVILTTQTTLGYQEDVTFHCGPGDYSDQVDPTQVISIGPLIDIATVAGGNDQNATIVGMDANGNLLFCAPGDNVANTPYALEMPPLGWGQIKGFTLSANGKEMYVLDSKAIWIYIYDNKVINEETNEKETGPRNYIAPTAFFSGTQMPANMAGTVDLAAYGRDMFLLFEDDHVSMCTYSGLKEAPTTCQDPVQFLDTRAGHGSGATISDAIFSQLLFDPPYNTALFLLEPDTHAIFMVNPHPTSLEFMGQLRADRNLERNIFLTTPATVMAIDTNRYLYLCIGNQVYYAAMP